MSEQLKAVVTVGVSASGKSTFAEEWVKKGIDHSRMIASGNGHPCSRVEINRDSIRRSLVEKTGKKFAWKSWNWKREKEVTANQYKQWLDYIGRKKYVPDASKPRCILVDIDGTLAHMNGKRGAFEWDKVGLDDVDEMVRAVVVSLSLSNRDFAMNEKINVIVLSGRDGVCEPLTKQWLAIKAIPHDRLIMRAPGDMRKDTVVKEEIFWRDIADNYNVMFAIDDRPSVCRMWREIGLKTFQVGDPHVEF